jgi:hypothetical protein
MKQVLLTMNEIRCVVKVRKVTAFLELWGGAVERRFDYVLKLWE